MDLLNEVATVFFLQSCIISITGKFNRPSTIVVVFGVTVPYKTLSDKLQSEISKSGGQRPYSIQLLRRRQPTNEKVGQGQFDSTSKTKGRDGL